MKKVLSVFIALFLVIALFACNGDCVNPEVLEVQLIP